jgi:uncharacterized protein (TIGR02145 family)
MRRILLMALLLSSFSLYSQEPVIKIDIGNGNYKTYNLSDIQNISLTNYNNNASLWIYYQKTKTISQEISGIDSIKFESNQTNFTNLVLYIKGSTPKSCVLSEIDSLKIKETLQDKYETVTIGTQVWMKKNLDVDHYRNGDSIPEVRDMKAWENLTSGAWCYYNNDSTLGKIYGKLYNWYAVNDSRGLAPSDWHIPSDSEWIKLDYYLFDEDLKVSGGKMKETGTTHWQSPNTGATNSSGFSGLPGGWRHYSTSFSGLGKLGIWWTSSNYDTDNAFNYYLIYDDDRLLGVPDYKYGGYSVRCVKDTISVIPEIYSITPVSAKIGDEIAITGARFTNTRGTSFVSFKSDQPKPNDYINWSNAEIKVKIPTGATTGKVSVIVNGEKSNEIDFTLISDNSLKITSIEPSAVSFDDILTINGSGFGSLQDISYVSLNNTTANIYTTWSDKQIKVKVPTGTVSGKLSVVVNGTKSNEVNFTVLEDFETVTIGTQVWIKKNLDVDYYRNGDPIPNVTDTTEWKNLKTGAWCYYNNDPAMGAIYGKLYNWYAVNDPRGLAPAGWHIPSDAEWKTLADTLGGKDVAGGKMKETGTTHWLSPNTGATNSTGFSALPGGLRNAVGNYGSLGYNGLWWTVTEESLHSKDGISRYMNYKDTKLSVEVHSKNDGYSVRCVKD